MKLKPLRHWLLAVAVLAAGGCAGRPPGFTLTLAHVNDTHGHLEPVSLSFTLDNATISTQAAGFARLAATIKKLRSEHDNLLFVHAGDAFQGTLYFNRFAGRADCNLLNYMGLDAMAVGNHELDRGPQALADFAAQADFDLLAANIDTSREPLLTSCIKPYCIKRVGGRDIGIIGLTVPETPQLSQPGSGLTFLDPQESAQKAIGELTALGIRAIIILSHLGYPGDIELAARLPEIDIIAGGHTHTLLGDFSALGLESRGPYPTVCKNADNDTVLVVQAGEWARVVGALTVFFDETGTLTGWQAKPLMPVGTAFHLESGHGSKAPAPEQMVEKIREKLARSFSVLSIDEDAAAAQLLKPYSQEIASLYKLKITRAPDDIVHVRLPCAQYPAGSQLAPLLAEAMLWKLRSRAVAVDAALTNAGAVRGSLARGAVTVGHIEGLLPFDDTLVVCSLTGSELKEALESGIDRALTSSESGAFPYVAGLRYSADAEKPAGRRVASVELQHESGSWVPLEEKAAYRIVTNSYLLRGGDGYAVLARQAESARDTGFGDAEAFIEYAGQSPELKHAPDGRIIFLKHWK